MHASDHHTPQYKRILVPTDGSDGARHAAEAAAELAQISGGRVIALHVLEPDMTDAEYLGTDRHDRAPAPGGRAGRSDAERRGCRH